MRLNEVNIIFNNCESERMTQRLDQHGIPVPDQILFRIIFRKSNVYSLIANVIPE